MYLFVQNDPILLWDALGEIPRITCHGPSEYSPGCICPYPNSEYGEMPDPTWTGNIDGCTHVPANPTGFCDFTPACNAHDRCYQQCCTGDDDAYRASCDSSFYQNMMSLCDDCAGGNFSRLWRCYAAARTYYFGVRFQPFGGWAFEGDQLQACKCCKCCR